MSVAKSSVTAAKHSLPLLVTFDAFGTLFSPRLPIATQYAMVAKKHNVIVEEARLKTSFREVFRSVRAEFPNYGRGTPGMTPEIWWAKVIKETFKPQLTTSTELPRHLIPELISHFASAAAYTLHPAIPSLLPRLRSNTDYPTTILGVLSNSDPRVTSILRSLNVSVASYQKLAFPKASTCNADDSRLTTNEIISAHNAASCEKRVLEHAGDIDFLTLSYEERVEKPAKELFEAAERKAAWIVRLQKHEGGGVGDGFARRVHIGDDVEKDVEGARGAGWTGVLWGGKRDVDQVLEEILVE